MKCANHPLNDAAAYCGQCGRPICAECKRDVGGMVYCESCLATRLRDPFHHIVGGAAGPSPGVALALGFIPGVGAIYNGQITKAFVQVLIFASLIALGDRFPAPMNTIFGLSAAAFYFYMLIDSYRTAQAKSSGQPAPEWFGLSEIKLGVPVGAAVLIGIGVIVLLDNFNVPVIREISRFWPVLLIVAGVLLMQRRLGGPKPEAPASTPAGGKPTRGPGNISGEHRR